jgi:hypothetical protein
MLCMTRIPSPRAPPTNQNSSDGREILAQPAVRVANNRVGK